MSAEQLLELAKAKGLMISTAESCTGGLIAAALTDIAGSSAVFDRGFVTYSNAAKAEMLGVNLMLITRHGAVSEEVAAEMAAGALARSQAALSVAVTGVAGPGGTPDKPEGMVCFGVATKYYVETSTQQFGSRGRAAVRTATVSHAIMLCLEKLKAWEL
ncbi:MAG: CinA family protein [Pseudomonadota bacterium]